MGRGRGKGKKLTAVSSHEDPGSGAEDSIPAYKRRGRPQKSVKDELDEEEVQNIEEEEEIKPLNITKDNKVQTGVTENGKKRKRHAQITDSLDLGAEKNVVASRSTMDEATKPNVFKRNGSRRKSKPRRAAEAGVEYRPLLLVFQELEEPMFVQPGLASAREPLNPWQRGTCSLLT